MTFEQTFAILGRFADTIITWYSALHWFPRTLLICSFLYILLFIWMHIPRYINEDV